MRQGALVIAAGLVLALAGVAEATDEVSGTIVVREQQSVRGRPKRPKIWLNTGRHMVRIRHWKVARFLVRLKGLHAKLWGTHHRAGKHRWFWPTLIVSPTRAQVDATFDRDAKGKLRVATGSSLAKYFRPIGPSLALLEKYTPRRSKDHLLKVRIDAWFFPDAPDKTQLYVEALVATTRTTEKMPWTPWYREPRKDASWRALRGVRRAVWARTLQTGYVLVKADPGQTGWVREDHLQVGLILPKPKPKPKPKNKANGSSGGLSGKLGSTGP